MRNWLCAALIGAFLFALPFQRVTAQPVTGPSTLTEQQIRASADTAIREHKAPLEAEKLTLQRLNENQFLPDSLLVDVVDAWVRFETPAAPGAAPDTKHFQESRRFIDLLLGYASARPSLAIQLHSAKALLYLQEGDRVNEVNEGQIAEALVNDLHNQVAEQLVVLQIRQGDALFAVGKRQEADAIYLEALNFPWWTLNRTRNIDRMAQHYIEAGKRLLVTRRGDAPALKQLSFVPGAGKTLSPLLKQAIEEAEKDPVGIKLKEELRDKLAAKSFQQPTP